MEPVEHSMKIGGIDVGKRWLDVAVHGSQEVERFGNDEASIADLIGWLRARGVTRVGLEASGGYERQARTQLERAGLEMVLHQALEVRLFARLKRLRAKNDRLDAQVIAAATAQVESLRAAQDERLQELADRLTAYEQISDQLAQLTVFMEHVRLKDVSRDLMTQIRSLQRLKSKLMQEIVRRIRLQPDLARRLELLLSLPGVGPVVAASLVVRMPELGTMKRGQAAALLGVAPFDRDSGQLKGQRRIAGGRRRPRRLVYIAALCAKRCDPGFKAFAARLAGLGKAPKLVTVAVMRKLIEAANLVLARQQPWIPYASS